MNKTVTLVIFLIINFGGLALGSWLMNNGPETDWYLNLKKAPWTPPGWVFGAAWTTIMICFSIYLANLFSVRKSKFIIIIFIIALILNISWNYVFFNQHQITLGLINIIALTLTIIYFFISFGDDKISKLRYLLLPYIIWLCLATSLNAYIVLNN